MTYNAAKREKLLYRLKEAAKKMLEKKILEYDWSAKARKEQLFPRGKWRVWLILAGRGFGKTRTGAEAVRHLISMGYKNIGLVAETAQELRRVMLEGESGLLRIFPPHERPKYFPSRNLLLWKNCAKAMLFSSENPESLRGPQFDAVWIDELAKFRNAEECWRQILMCLRLGQNPKIIITTTPRSIKLLKDLLSRKDVYVTRGSTFENSANLSSDFIATIAEEYGNTTFGQQELYGELLEKECFWSEINYCDEVPEMEEIIVAVDPAISNNSNSDETGIIVAGRARNTTTYKNNQESEISDLNQAIDMNNLKNTFIQTKTKYYVLEDLSTKAKVQDWINVVIDAYYKYDAGRIVVEINQGGDFIKEMIFELDRAKKSENEQKFRKNIAMSHMRKEKVIVEEVRATVNKGIRAQPVAILYQQGHVLHVNRFRELENQMLSFGCRKSSPDRVDALVWAITKLKEKKGSRIVNIF